jgi:putative oxidoreductase
MNTVLRRHHVSGLVAGTDYLLVLARFFMTALFVFSAIEKIVKYDDFVGFATAGGLPLAPLMTPLIVLAELGASLMLIVGWNAKLAAAFFAVFCLIVGPWFHQFWNPAIPADKWQDVVDGFFHHYVMAGGFIFLAVHGPGRLSLDARACSK